MERGGGWIKKIYEIKLARFGDWIWGEGKGNGEC